jgi:ATP-dependent Clp protease adapter protein ClpS
VPPGIAFQSGNYFSPVIARYRRDEVEVAMSIRPHYWRNERSGFRAFGIDYPIRRFKVLLHGAVERDLMFVARVVMELTRFGSAEAEFRMWEAYHRGRSLVVVTHLERAELFVEQFRDRGLAATIEPE